MKSTNHDDQLPPVYIDVYPWIQAIIDNGGVRVPMEGIFRHALALSRKYTPAVLVEDAWSVNLDPTASKLLEQLLGCAIEQVHTDYVGKNSPEAFWVTLTPECTCPFLDKLPLTKCCIIHDTHGLEGIFGAEKKEAYIRGVKAHDVFLYVSLHTKRQFAQQAAPFIGQNAKTVRYSCFHMFGEDVLRITNRGYAALTVGNIYPHKNLHLVNEHTRRNLHIHVGQLMMPELPASLRSSSLIGKFAWLGPLNDATLISTYQWAREFWCLSSHEGFSITPLEAIVCGVQYIYLSDIPVHREIYSGLASFDLREWAKKVTWEQRRECWERFTFDNAIKEFEKFRRNLA